MIEQADIKEFKNTVMQYFKTHKRDFLWRYTDNAYHILVSEFMLQQTQISRVQQKFTSFIEEFPTIKALALAQLEDVFRTWQGLGYNRRAKFLHETAKLIYKDFKGEVPLDVEILDSFPGIGNYTAKAIYTFSTNKPTVFIETNIRSVFIYHFYKCKEVSDIELLSLIEQTLDKKDPRSWYYALMDYGTHIKKTYGNINVQSKHYSKQSKFEGSKRQVRGEILRQVLSHTNVNRKLLNQISTVHDTNEIINAMILENILVEDKNGIIKISN